MNISFSINKILYILAVAVVLGFLYNHFSPSGINLIREEIVLEEYNSDESISNTADYSKIKAVKIDDAYQFYLDGVTFVDSRDMWEFGDGHIAGAINFPEIEFSTDHPALKKLDKTEPLVIYCSSADCGTSTDLAIKLQRLGYQNLFVFEEGWDAWLERDYPIETSVVE
ncbi:MAG: rhodanese-like domain-containing protein [Melioribacteraceae bacterium]|nr:rhodanese-like domain-containing protein [Melioribacteraceae bacterium]